MTKKRKSEVRDTDTPESRVLRAWFCPACDSPIWWDPKAEKDGAAEGECDCRYWYRQREGRMFTFEYEER